MEGNLQLLYVLLTDCYVYLLRKGACRPRPEWVGLNSPPPSSYPHFKHILMTRCPREGLLAGLHTRSVVASPCWVQRGLGLRKWGWGTGKRPARVMGTVISSLRGHREAIPGGRSHFLQ